jgi:hypothetical protein
MKRFLPLLLLLLMVGCVSPHKTYHAPSSAKVDRSTKVLTEKVLRARETAAQARRATLEAQALAVTVAAKLAILKGKVPPELVPMVTDVQTATTAQDAKLVQAIALNDLLQKRQQEEETARVQLQNDQSDYAAASAGLAGDATNERNNLIKTQKALLASRFGGIMVKLGAILFCVIVIFLVIAKMAGKLSGV